MKELLNSWIKYDFITHFVLLTIILIIIIIIIIIIITDIWTTYYRHVSPFSNFA